MTQRREEPAVAIGQHNFSVHRVAAVGMQWACQAWSGTPLAGPAATMYDRIAVALDGSPLAEQILPYVLALAEKFGSTLILVRAILPEQKVAALVEPAVAGVPLDPTLVEETMESEEDAARTYLASVANDFRRRGIEVQTEHPHGLAAATIVGAALRRQADVIALTTHGRSGLGRLIFGSVADEVLHTAPGPVLLVRSSTDASGR